MADRQAADRKAPVLLGQVAVARKRRVLPGQAAGRKRPGRQVGVAKARVRRRPARRVADPRLDS